jgi:hypothetical protein
MKLRVTVGLFIGLLFACTGPAGTPGSLPVAQSALTGSGSLSGTLAFPVGFAGSFNMVAADGGAYLGQWLLLSDDSTSMDAYCANGKLPETSGSMRVIQFFWNQMPAAGTFDAVEAGADYQTYTFTDAGVSLNSDLLAGQGLADAGIATGNGGSVTVSSSGASGIAGTMNLTSFVDSTGQVHADTLSGTFNAQPCAFQPPQ